MIIQSRFPSVNREKLTQEDIEMSSRKSQFYALHECMADNYLEDENSAVQNLLARARTSKAHSVNIQNTAANLIKTIRNEQQQASGLQAFLNHYDLSSQEGVVLMCIAEALLRIPDNETMDALISDKLSSASWDKHLGESHSLFVNASTWALMLTGQTLKPQKAAIKNPKQYISKLFTRMKEPVVRAAMKSAMRIMAWQFVMGRTISEALKRSRSVENKHYRYSFDMLGEAAITTDDAEGYQQAYASAIEKIGASVDTELPEVSRPGISIKLSALCPRYEYTQKERAISELSQRLLELTRLAQKQGIGLTVDAEEADRLEMSLIIFEKVFRSTCMENWNGFGLVVQAYQKRALTVIKWLNQLAQRNNRIIPLRLVKGAYWDTEIKHAQEQGLSGYPVFTRKCNTDVSYQACARYLLEECHSIYPQFATHNAQTLAYVYHHAGTREYEFQRLHGMGGELYEEVIDKNKLNIPCRVYAPVGKHEDLLPYLVRRLLENGANTSFVNQMAHEESMNDEINIDPVLIAESLGNEIQHPGIPLPANIFGNQRLNSSGINFSDSNEVDPLQEQINATLDHRWDASPIINGESVSGIKCQINNPANAQPVGQVSYTRQKDIFSAVDIASRAWPEWNATPAKYRAGILNKAADIFEQHQATLIAMCVREAGKTVIDSHGEIREAVDFLRYYAVLAKKHFGKKTKLNGPTGEKNELAMQGRGVFVCISPWNFPIAIFTGQIAAALVAGNTVIAKPAEQTSLMAHYVTRLLLEAGTPSSVLHFLPGDGKKIGETLLSDPRIAGVAFTGSCDTARLINRTLALRDGPIATLIAETGGQNTMLVDSSALPQQVVLDVVQSAFNSAGQRCSALRVLYLQEEIADEILTLLKGYMDELVIGDPLYLSTDVGPVIDQQAQQILETHIESISKHGNIIHRCHIPEELSGGSFIAPVVIEIDNIAQLENENFGPVLHVIRYKSVELDNVLGEINAIGYGLTLGIHSRIENRASDILERVKVGNVYVNRNMIGAVVGVQPFGGCGLSGTGPKAGGPNYLFRFANEQVYTVNTSAIGGNASLLTIE
jgi:RHH-type transcriptional regulator, proline utilization regulon repressor / proline dehydrogenase / delta 1-pyrroline-5-carboxylate dehydrogenase